MIGHYSRKVLPLKRSLLLHHLPLLQFLVPANNLHVRLKTVPLFLLYCVSGAGFSLSCLKMPLRSDLIDVALAVGCLLLYLSKLREFSFTLSPDGFFGFFALIFTKVLIKLPMLNRFVFQT